jgi:hypothetical protein
MTVGKVVVSAVAGVFMIPNNEREIVDPKNGLTMSSRLCLIV